MVTHGGPVVRAGESCTPHRDPPKPGEDFELDPGGGKLSSTLS